MLVRDRFDYGQSIADSWKRQMLMNVVRLRYADAPVFMDVTSLITSYQIVGGANAGLQLYSSATPNEVSVGANAILSNTPTVTYQPLTGDRFMKSLLQPIPPASIFEMLQAGWPADLVLRTAVRSINGLLNQGGAQAAEDRFDTLVTAVTRLQQASGLNIRVEEQKGGEAIVIALPDRDLSAQAQADAAQIRELLGIERTATEYHVTFGLTPRSPSEIALLTRSMLEIMIVYGVGIDLPAADRAEGRVTPGVASLAGAASLVHIAFGGSPPADAYAAIPYRGRWFWIDDRDVRSKTRFTFLMILSSLAETGQATITPVVTVPSR